MRVAALALTVGLAATPTLAQTAYAPTVLPAPGETACPGGLCQPEALTGEMLAFDSALPDDLQSFIDQLDAGEKRHG